MNYIVRPMRLSDVPQAVELDRECFPNERHSMPYQSDLLYNKMAYYLVACEKDTADVGEIIGLSGFWMMVDEAHIITIAVRNTRRRQGIGESLLRSTIELAKRLEAHEITLEVRSSNKMAQSLYAKYGFTERGLRKAYYDDTNENAVIMTRDIADR
ncbi:MAG: ribosomal protein S18-alanine N-acetyltransferase [Chloroflexota bacterium]|nr:ribosomal protein S18-alanine N-acetyltransferase [Chloroflexota bacterium]